MEWTELAIAAERSGMPLQMEEAVDSRRMEWR
jgi:hypothetical protein